MHGNIDVILYEENQMMSVCIYLLYAIANINSESIVMFVCSVMMIGKKSCNTTTTIKMYDIIMS